MENFNFKNIDSTGKLVDETIKFSAALEPDLTKEEALKRYEDLLQYVKNQMEEDEGKTGVGGKYYILAIQDFLCSCSLYRFYPNIAAILINCTIDSAKRIDLDEFCSGVVSYLNQCLKHKKWILSRNIQVIESEEDIEKFIDKAIKDESNICYN